MSTSTIIHNIVQTKDGQKWIMFPPPRTGCRSFRELIQSEELMHYPKLFNHYNTGSEHNPWPKTYEMLGYDISELKPFMLIRNPYNRMRSLWRMNIGQSGGVDRFKLSFADWLCGYYPLLDILDAIRAGEEYDPFDMKFLCSRYYAPLLTRYLEYVKRAWGYDVDDITFMRLENRPEEYEKIGFGPYPENEREVTRYMTSWDGMSDYEYYIRYPEIRTVVEWITARDLKLFDYSFDDIQQYHGSKHEYAHPPTFFENEFEKSFGDDVRFI